MTTFTLRPASLGDTDAIAALIRASFAAQSVVTDPSPSALRVTAAEVASVLASGGGMLAEAGGELAGSVLWAEKDRGLYLSRLAVSPAWRRRGVAKALIGAAQAAASAMGLRRLQLSTRLVLLDNRCLFAACGFVETTREAHPGYAEPTFVNMEKWLE